MCPKGIFITTKLKPLQIVRFWHTGVTFVTTHYYTHIYIVYYEHERALIF